MAGNVVLNGHSSTANDPIPTKLSWIVPTARQPIYSALGPPFMYSSVHHHHEAIGQQMQQQSFIGYPPPRAPFSQYSQPFYPPSPPVVYQHSYAPYVPQYVQQQQPMPMARQTLPPPPVNYASEQRNAAVERSVVASCRHPLQGYHQYGPVKSPGLPVQPKKVLAIVNPTTNEIENKDTFEANAGNLRSWNSAPSSSLHTEKPRSDSTLSDDGIDDDQLLLDATTLLDLEDDLSFPAPDENGVSAVESTSNKENGVLSQPESKASFQPSTAVGVVETGCFYANADRRGSQRTDASATAVLTDKAAKCTKWEKWLLQLKADKNEVDLATGVLGRDFLMLCGLIVRESNKSQCPVSIDVQRSREIHMDVTHKLGNPYWRLSERLAERERIAAAVVNNTLASTSASSVDDISAIVNSFFEKAVEDKKFFQLYSDLCKDVMLDEENKMGTKIRFHRALLNRCKMTFDPNRFQDLFDKTLRAEAENDEATRAQSISSCQKMEAEERLHIFGTVGFLGHMYIEGVSPSAVVRYCVANLFLRNRENNCDPQMIECAVRLLHKVGSRLDADSVADQSVKQVSRYYCHLSKIARKKSTPLQLQQLIDSLLELRQNNWIQ